MAKKHDYLLINVVVITPYCTFHEFLSSEVSFELSLTFWNRNRQTFNNFNITSHKININIALHCRGSRKHPVM